MNKKISLNKAGQKFSFTLSSGDIIRRNSELGTYAVSVISIQKGKYISVYGKVVESTNQYAFRVHEKIMLTMKPKTICDILK